MNAVTRTGRGWRCPNKGGSYVVSILASGAGRGWRGWCWPASVSPLLIWPRQSPAPRRGHKGGREAGGGEEVSDCHLGKMWTHYQAITPASGQPWASLRPGGGGGAGIPSGPQTREKGVWSFWKQLVSVTMCGFCRGWGWGGRKGEAWAFWCLRGLWGECSD